MKKLIKLITTILNLPINAVGIQLIIDWFKPKKKEVKQEEVTPDPLTDHKVKYIRHTF